MNRYSGVTLDYYDDRGEFLKTHFPTAEDVPDFIKTANIREKDELPNEAFALVASDEGRVMRKFACHDPGTTAMSVMYFMEHKDRLPKGAVKMAAANLTLACLDHNIAPPVPLIEMSDGIDLVQLEKNASRIESYLDRKHTWNNNPVDIAGQAASPIIKEASSNTEEDWAVIMPDGSRHYPIQTWDQIKTAEAYFMDNKHIMEPSIRRQFAVKLAEKSCKAGYPVKKEIQEAGAATKAKTGMAKIALEMRKLAGGDPEFLDELFEKHASLDPNVYAEVLHRFDRDTGLDRLWDNRIPDPWESTFGVEKTAERVVFEDGGDRVTEGQLQNLATNNLSLVTKQFTDDVAYEFGMDPVGIFHSMPLPQQRILARMAADVSSDGSSEGSEKLSSWTW
jgi:hypothetical protein